VAAPAKYSIETDDWTEPPAVALAAGEWPKRLARFAENPGRWGIVAFDGNRDTMRGVATRLNAGDYTGIERGQYEAVVGPHPTFNDKTAVWVRRIADEPEPEE
jgi:hypothetical protein